MKKEKEEVKKWAIFAGLGGGFGGAEFVEVFEGTKTQAEQYAYDTACDRYESYGGIHGLLSVEDVLEENPEYTEEEAMEEVKEDMESWVDYRVEEYNPKKEY